MSRSERLVKKLAQVDMGALGWPEAVKTLTRFVEDARTIAAKEWKPSTKQGGGVS